MLVQFYYSYLGGKTCSRLYYCTEEHVDCTNTTMSSGIDFDMLVSTSLGYAKVPKVKDQIAAGRGQTFNLRSYGDFNL